MAIKVSDKSVVAFFNAIFPDANIVAHLNGADVIVSVSTSTAFTGLTFKKDLLPILKIAVPINTILAVGKGVVPANDVNNLAVSIYTDMVDMLKDLKISTDFNVASFKEKDVGLTDMYFDLPELKTAGEVKIEMPVDISTFKELGQGMAGVSVNSVYYGAILGKNIRVAIRIRFDNTVGKFMVSIRALASEHLYESINLKGFGFTKAMNYASTHLACDSYNEMVQLIGAFYALVGQYVPDCKRLSIDKLLKMTGQKA